MSDWYSIFDSGRICGLASHFSGSNELRGGHSLPLFLLYDSNLCYMTPIFALVEPAVAVAVVEGIINGPLLLIRLSI